MLNMLWVGFLQVFALCVFCAFWLVSAPIYVAAECCEWVARYVDDLLEGAF